MHQQPGERSFHAGREPTPDADHVKALSWRRCSFRDDKRRFNGKACGFGDIAMGGMRVRAVCPTVSHRATIAKVTSRAAGAETKASRLAISSWVTASSRPSGISDTVDGARLVMLGLGHDHRLVRLLTGPDQQRRRVLTHQHAGDDRPVGQLEHLRLVLIRDDLRRPEDRLENVAPLEPAGQRGQVRTDVLADRPEPMAPGALLLVDRTAGRRPIRSFSSFMCVSSNCFAGAEARACAPSRPRR